MVHVIRRSASPGKLIVMLAALVCTTVAAGLVIRLLPGSPRAGVEPFAVLIADWAAFAAVATFLVVLVGCLALQTVDHLRAIAGALVARASHAPKGPPSRGADLDPPLAGPAGGTAPWFPMAPTSSPQPGTRTATIAAVGTVAVVGIGLALARSRRSG